MIDNEVANEPETVPEVPGYRLLDCIGEGGMGRVYRATQLSLQRTVAIKFLHGPPVRTPRSTGRQAKDSQAPELGSPSAFHRESRLMAALSHPNVVTIYDFGQIDGRHYLVMEYLAGKTLRSRMRPGVPWSARAACKVLEPIANSLSYIHEQGILHLDLKPENVLCTEHGDVKITDFGLATPRVDARTLSELGLARGTLDYCSPEQRFGLPLDQRSDVFSLSALAYELLTGKLPGRVYVPASNHNSALPAAVDEVLRRGLARDPQYRQASAEEWRRQILAALHGTRPGWRRRALLAAAGLAILLAVTFPLFRPLGKRSRVPSLTRVPVPNLSLPDFLASHSLDEDTLVVSAIRNGKSHLLHIRPDGTELCDLTQDQGDDGDPAWSPGGHRIAFTSIRPGGSDVFVMNPDGSGRKQLTSRQGINRTPAWSPDGRQIAFVSERDGNSEVYVMEGNGSNPVNLTRDPGFDGDPAWSPDGRRLAFTALPVGAERYLLFLMEADGKNRRRITQCGSPMGNVYPAWSPDGKQLVYGDATTTGVELFLCDADGANERQLTNLGGMNMRPAWSPDGKVIALLHVTFAEDRASLYFVDALAGTAVPVLHDCIPTEGGRPAWRPRGSIDPR